MKTAPLAVMVLSFALAPSLGPGVARGEVPDAFAASDEPRIDASPVPGSSIERVRGTVSVDASIERVRQVVFDFPRYPEYMPHYRRASVERRNPNGSVEVRMDIEELAGAVHVWVRLEVTAAEPTGGVESYKGRLLAGNVKAFEIGWKLESLGPKKTRLTVESFMDPNLRLVPSAFINSGARDRVREVILALKARAERAG
jgi:ribosome-associated toxin RatA of RatAB toxin-antitoxin module